MILFSLLFLSSQILLAEVNMVCESPRSLILNDGVGTNPEKFRIVTGDKGKTFRYTSGAQTLIFNSQTGQFFWENRAGSTQLIQKSPTGRYSTVENINSRTPLYRPISNPFSKVVDVIQKIGKKGFEEKSLKCARRQSFRQKLRNPMTSFEVRKCGDDLKLLNRINRCIEDKNCPEVFESVKTLNSLNPPFSFDKMFKEEIVVPDPLTDLWLPLAVDSVVSNTVPNLMFFNIAKAAAIASRVGLSFWGLYSLLQALTATTKPILIALLYNDMCGSEDLILSSKKSIEDCVGRSAGALMNTFAQNIETAITHPDQFIRQIDSASNGLNGRLACFAIEGQVNEWIERTNVFRRYSCQGKTISVGNGNVYIMGKNNTLYRHESRQRTLHFELNKPMQVENRDTGERSVPIPVNSISRNDKDLKKIIPMKIFYEEKIIQAMMPGLLKQFGSGNCLPKSSEYGEKVAQ